MKLIIWLPHKIKVSWCYGSIFVSNMTLLLTFAIGLAVTAHAIIVERNYHLYFRVPIAIGGASNSGDTKFHIMQCPPVSGGAVIMPKPQDMTICVIVGIYTHRAGGKQPQLQQLHPTPVKARPRSKLRTKVDYTRRKEVHRASVREPKSPTQPIFQVVPRNLQPYDRRRHTKVENNKPLSSPPASLQQDRRWQEQQNDQQYVANNNFEQITNPESVDEGVREDVEKEEKEEGNGDGDEMTNAKKDNADDHNEEYDNTNYDYDYDVKEDTEVKTNDESTMDDEYNTPLKYIGVRDLIKKFAKNAEKDFFNPESKANKSDSSDSNNDNDDDFSLESERFFANHETFANGDKLKSFQNSYHRDEFYNDHIFYDDEEDNGGYHTHSKVHERF